MSNFCVQHIKPAVLKSKEVATVVDVEAVDNKVNTVDTRVEDIISGGVDLSNAKVGDTSLTSFVQNEVDKKVNIYSGEDITTFTGVPSINDIYIENTTVTSLSGIPIDVVNTYKYNGTSWVRIGNNDNLTALADLVDGKRTVFTTPTTPTPPYDKGDLWVLNSTIKVTTIDRTSGTGIASDWATVSNYTSKTSELSDDANLGKKAEWDSISGTGKPQDNADITLDHFAGNGINLIPPEFTAKLSRIFSVSDNAPDIYFSINSTTYNKKPALRVKVDRGSSGPEDMLYLEIVSNVGVKLTAGKTYFVSLRTKEYNFTGDINICLISLGNTTGLCNPKTAEGRLVFQYTPTVSTDYYFKIDIRKMNDPGGSPTFSTYLFDFMVEEKIGKRDTASPYIAPVGTTATVDLNNGVQLSDGGIEMTGGAIKNTTADLAARNGIFLGYDNGKYQFLAGNGSSYIYFDGTNIRIKGAIFEP